MVSTQLTAIEIANCVDNGGGWVVWQRQPHQMINVGKRQPHGEKWRPWGVNRVDDEDGIRQR